MSTTTSAPKRAELIERSLDHLAQSSSRADLRTSQIVQRLLAEVDPRWLQADFALTLWDELQNAWKSRSDAAPAGSPLSKVWKWYALPLLINQEYLRLFLGNRRRATHLCPCRVEPVQTAHDCDARYWNVTYVDQWESERPLHVMQSQVQVVTFPTDEEPGEGSLLVRDQAPGAQQARVGIVSGGGERVIYVERKLLQAMTSAG